MSHADPQAPTVEYAARGPIAEIALNRPESANAMDLKMARSLKEALDRAGADTTIAVILLHGHGSIFCCGGDLRAMAAAPDRPAFLAELAAAAHDVVRVADSLPKPLVVAAQGAAAGIGLSLVLAGDVVVVGESAKLVTAYTSVGLTPDGGMSWRLPRVIGQRRALEAILTSDPMTSARALELGIASEVSPDSDVLARAREHALALAGRPAVALAEARRLVRSSWDRSLDEHLDDEAATIAAASGTEVSRGLIDRFIGAQ